MGFETPEEGFLAKILYTAGSKDIPVGKLVCIIVENEGDVAAFKDFKDDGGSAPAKPAAAPAAAPQPAAPAPAAAAPPPPAPSRPAGIQTASEQKFGDRVLASPMAKRLAEQQKMRLDGRGSGLYGSLTSKDLSGMESASAAPSAGAQAVVFPPGQAYVDIPVSNVRGVIAKRLLESKNTIPHYYLTVDCNVDKILELRTRFNKSLEKSGSKLSVNDFIIKAAAIACKKVPEVNSAWLGNVIRQ